MLYQAKHFEHEGMGVALSETQLNVITRKYDVRSMNNMLVHLKEGTESSDFCQAVFVMESCQHGCCLRNSLYDFINGDDQTTSPAKQVASPICTRGISTYVSPTVQRYQEQIYNATFRNDNDRDMVGDTACHDGKTNLDMDGEVSDDFIHKVCNNTTDETFGGLKRADIRKRCIESIDSILNSHKFPDRYAKILQDGISQLVGDIHQQRKDEVSEENGKDHREYEFPGDEVKRGQVQKRMKNSLG